MSVKEKFKGIKKRWYWLTVLILLIGIAGAAKYGVEKHFKTQIETERVQQTYQLVGNDLLYLENFQSMKITQEEAKALLPLVERLASSTDQNLQRDLAKEIYGQLTPQQYATLLDQGKGSGENQFNGKNVVGEIRKGGERPKETMEKDFLGDRKFNKNGNTIREEALSNVVEKMLTDRSQGK